MVSKAIRRYEKSRFEEWKESVDSKAMALLKLPIFRGEGAKIEVSCHADLTTCCAHHHNYPYASHDVGRCAYRNACRCAYRHACRHAYRHAYRCAYRHACRHAYPCVAP